MEAFMTTKSERVSARVEPEVLAIVERVAAAERRPVANLIRNIVSDWAVQRREPAAESGDFA
jgi:hypothetical protein